MSIMHLAASCCTIWAQVQDTGPYCFVKLATHLLVGFKVISRAIKSLRYKKTALEDFDFPRYIRYRFLKLQEMAPLGHCELFRSELFGSCVSLSGTCAWGTGSILTRWCWNPSPVKVSKACIATGMELRHVLFRLRRSFLVWNDVKGCERMWKLYDLYINLIFKAL